jgi:inositol-1,4,5-trisphosphate 5-phosphatase
MFSIIIFSALLFQSTVDQNWLAEFEKVVVQADPDLVALHCQEVGGKDFELCMPKVQDFVR